MGDALRTYRDLGCLGMSILTGAALCGIISFAAFVGESQGQKSGSTGFIFLLFYGGLISLANSRLRKYRISKAVADTEARQQTALDKHQEVVANMTEHFNDLLRETAQNVDQSQTFLRHNVDEALLKLGEELSQLRQRLDLAESRLALAERRPPENPYM